MKETVETEVKKINYRVVDKNNGQIITIVDDLHGIDVLVNTYAKKNYGINRTYHSPNLLENDRNLKKLEFKRLIRTEVDYNVEVTGERHWYTTRPYPRRREIYEFVYCFGFYIETELGDLIDTKNIPRSRYSRKNREYEEKLDEKISFNLIKRNNNVNRIKDSYQTAYSHYSGYAYPLHSGNRTIKTFQSLKYCENVCVEDGEPEFRGKRKNLPHSWDDIQNDIYSTRKSWKHNSKRRKQWKVKTST